MRPIPPRLRELRASPGRRPAPRETAEVDPEKGLDVETVLSPWKRQ
jgi:hypothetical protein